MTIILAIPATDGLVLASDGQITSGGVRATGKKIKRLNENCLWGASGRDALTQRVEEQISGLSDNTGPLQSLRDVLSGIIRKCAIDLYQLDQQPPEEDFIFGEFLKNTPRILHITVIGTPEWIKTGAYGVGVGRPFVHALLQKYQFLIPDRIDVQKGAVLAFKVIEEAIDVGGQGLGRPIDIWQITKEGVKNLDDKKTAALEDLSRGLREAELNALLEE